MMNHPLAIPPVETEKLTSGVLHSGSPKSFISVMVSLSSWSVARKTSDTIQRPSKSFTRLLRSQ